MSNSGLRLLLGVLCLGVGAGAVPLLLVMGLAGYFLPTALSLILLDSAVIAFGARRFPDSFFLWAILLGVPAFIAGVGVALAHGDSSPRGALAWLGMGTAFLLTPSAVAYLSRPKERSR